MKFKPVNIISYIIKIPYLKSKVVYGKTTPKKNNSFVEGGTFIEHHYYVT